MSYLPLHLCKTLVCNKMGEFPHSWKLKVSFCFPLKAFCPQPHIWPSHGGVPEEVSRPRPFLWWEKTPTCAWLTLTLCMSASAVWRSAVLWRCYCCRHAHDGVSAGAVGEAHGCSRSQPVHIPLRGHHQPWKPHQGDKRERHEGLCTLCLLCILSYPPTSCT